ncbi:MFS transporter [Pullulanibacillus sp. KACC 23026]|uniref:MFS transporter n=1 Tax=Pullulanibacillus sp. KACC 23026 TaxID=3028315 RepID=UPI0023AEDEF0|nr:MFS transporter [Pullulanibacillus sp. KACC 23026]WEG11827.1 MFS transporter [Pullulanibacillus sp. KACC 23026]
MENRIQRGSKEGRINPWLVFSATSLSAVLVMLNLGALNVALPAITRHFHVSSSLSSWILLSYMLVNTILILVFGQLSDVFGRKVFFLIGTAIFTLSSFLIGFSPNIWMFIAWRVIQAGGGALIISNNTALISDAFPKEKLAKGLGMNVLVASAAQLLGPVIGGVLASAFGWKWVFWAGVPVGLAGLIWGIPVLRGLPSFGSGKKVDYFGGILIFIGLSGLILSLSEGSTLGWTSYLVLIGWILFIICLPLFIWYERHHPSPMVDFQLFRDRAYTMGNVSTFLNAFTRVSVVLLSSLYMQSVLNYKASWAGIGVLPVTIGMLIASPITGNLSDRFSARLLATTGLSISGLGVIVLIIGEVPDLSYWISGAGMFLVGLGSGLFMTPNTKEILTSVPSERRGFANGLRSMLQNMGQVLSTAISLTIVSAVLPPQLKDVVTGGSSQKLSFTETHLLTQGFRYAFLTLLLATCLGVFVSAFRGKSRVANRKKL